MNHDFMDRIAKIIAEVRTRTCIDGIDAEALFEILQDELIKYHNEAYTYGRNTGYDDGYADGRESGLDDGRAEAAPDNETYTKEAVERAYDAGYSLGYYDGAKADFNSSK